MRYEEYECIQKLSGLSFSGYLNERESSRCSGMFFHGKTRVVLWSYFLVEQLIGQNVLDVHHVVVYDRKAR